MLALAVVAIYHWRWCERGALLTPGEMLDGAAVRDSEKVWLTPYVRSRELLFLSVAATLLMNVPDIAYTSVERVAGFALTVLLIPCLIAIGRGHPVALVGLGAYRVWQAYAATGTTNPRASVETLTEYAAAALFVIGCAVVALIYQGRLVRKQLAPAL